MLSHSITASGLLWSVVMGAGTTALAYVAWYVCQRSMSGTAAGSAQLVVPILTAAGAVLLLGEEVSATLLGSRDPGRGRPLAWAAGPPPRATLAP